MKNENKKIARLIKQIQRGNQSAFEEFYKLTSPKAYFIALKITQNEHDAEDILQESYIKALEKINEIDTSQNINSWFLKIVSNKSKDLLKSRNRLVFEGEEETVFEEIPEEKAEFCPEESLNQEELRLEVMAAIDELTAEKRACIMMMYFGDMSVKEIAESIEVPESTVKNRLYTARKDLKAKFEKNGNVLYGAALGGVLIWALGKTSVTASATFLASAASAEIVAGATAAYTTAATATTATAATASTAAASTAATTAASAGTGIAAKIAVVSVAQKIAVGVAATAVIGGSTAGVVTVVKNVTPEESTTQITEAVTTAHELTTEYVFNEMTLPATATETVSSTENETHRESTKASTERTSTTEYTTAPASTTKSATRKETTTQKQTTVTNTTTRKETTTQTATTTRADTTTREETTEETTTRKATTTRKETTTQKATTTTRPETTVTTTQPETTTVPATTEPTIQAKATVSIDIIDLDGSVVDTLTIEVEAGTTLSKEYIVTAVQAKGYEPMAGVYGDDIGTVAQGGNTYKFEAEL